MAKKPAHPDIQLFEYLNGALDASAVQAVEAHLSACGDCASAAAMIRALKEEASGSNLKSEPQVSVKHPDISELASFFYAASQRSRNTNVAAHVALCGSCAEAIAVYARAERAAVAYKPANAAAGAVPAKAWEMIRDWEDSSFAKLKPASEVIGRELLARLSLLFDEKTRSARQQAERIPVLVVSSSGEVRSVEYFEKVEDSTGASVLRHAEGSKRFDNKLFHVLLYSDEREPVVVSDLISSSVIRLHREARPIENSLREDYFIIED